MSVKYTIYKLKKLLKWIPIFWRDNDFDALTIYPILEYKLKEIQTGMLSRDFDNDEKNLQAIRIAIKLSNRLATDYHETKLHERNDRKWGKAEMYTSPGEKEEYYKVHFTRKNIRTEADYQQDILDFKDMMSRMQVWGSRDQKLLFAIMNKYINYWWS